MRVLVHSNTESLHCQSRNYSSQDGSTATKKECVLRRSSRSSTTRRACSRTRNIGEIDFTVHSTRDASNVSHSFRDRKAFHTESFQFHGTPKGCPLGQEDSYAQPCLSSSCALCSILRGSFEVERSGTSPYLIACALEVSWRSVIAQARGIISRGTSILCHRNIFKRFLGSFTIQ